MRRLSLPKKISSSTIHRWTDDKEQFLIDNYESMSNRELAEKLGVNVRSVANKLVTLDLRRRISTASKCKWTKDMEQFLIDNYETMSNRELAEKLGVNKTSVANKIYGLDLRRKGSFKKLIVDSSLRVGPIKNLKESNYQRRGLVAQLIVKLEFRLKMTYGHSPSSVDNLTLEDIYKDFLRKHWYSIDLFAAPYEHLDKFTYFDTFGPTLFEVKARTHGVKRRPDITTETLNTYREAIELGIPVKVAIVEFHDNWNYKIHLKDFDENDFRVNEGGYYRRREDFYKLSSKEFRLKYKITP